MFLVIIILIASAMSVMFALHEESDDSTAQIIKSGQCGPNAIYNIYSDGILEITGSGEMYHYEDTHAPWYDDRGDIIKIVISDNISRLGALAFFDCTYVTELTIPITLNSVVSDKQPVFLGCCNIEKINFTCGNGGYGYNYITYPSDSWYQKTPWYQSRSAIEEINFSDDIKVIGSNAFRDLNITSIILPDSVVNLGNHCFFNCSKLTDLTIPISLNSYGSNDKYPAFRGCMAVQKVTFTKGNGIPFDYYDWTKYVKNDNLAPWNMNPDIAKTIIIADNITDLGYFMFFKCNIKEVTVPISLSITLCTAFCSQYNNLRNVTITQGTGAGIDFDSFSQSLQNCPWGGVSNIDTLTVEEGVTYIGDYTFPYCSIKNLILPNSLVSLGKSPFFKCNIKNLTIPISLNATWLDNSPAFKKVFGIEEVDFTPGSGYGFMYAAYKGSNCWYQLTPWYQCRDTLKEINFAEGIKRIGSDAFRELHLTSIVIPNSVKSIGCHAFYNMADLSTLSIPITLDSVTSNKYPAFHGCVNIEKMIFTGTGNWFRYGDSDSQHSYYGYTPWQFSKATLKSVDMYYGAASVGKLAFEGCTSLESITIPSSVRTIGHGAFNVKFYETDGVTELEETASNLAGYTFKNVDGKWIKLELPLSDADHTIVLGKCGDEVKYKFDLTTGTLTIGGTGQMYDFSIDTSPWFLYRGSILSVYVGSSVTSIGNYAFYDCFALSSVSLPESVCSIGNSTFSNCTSLTTIAIPDPVKSIEESTFEGCLSLFSVFIGSSVSSIEESAFKECSSLASFDVSAENASYSSIDGVLFDNDKTTLILFPPDKAGISYVIPDKVKTIAPFAFNCCTGFTSITFPNSITTIELDAFDMIFYSSDYETALAPRAELLAGSIFNYICGKWVKEKEFGKCGDNATYEFDFPTGNLSINGSGPIDTYYFGNSPWFSYKEDILSIDIGDSITSIGYRSFEGLTSIVSIIIPDSVKFICASAFEGCTSLVSVNIGCSIRNIAVSAFAGCISLESFVVSVENSYYSSIDGVLFDNDKPTLLEYPVAKVDSSYVVSATIRVIISFVLKDCKFLKSITFSDSITYIVDDAFGVPFYDIGGEIEIEPNASNLAGYTFKYIDGKWTRQAQSTEYSSSDSA